MTAPSSHDAPLSPAESRAVLTIDPRRQFGRVCVEGTRVPADAIAKNVAAGDGVDRVADDYQITREQVLLCCLWYSWECLSIRRNFERKVAKAWDKWADEALYVLGGHKPGPLADPPEIDGQGASDEA